MSQLASNLSIIASSFFLLFFNYNFSIFLELNHIQFSLHLISIMLEYFEWCFCLCCLLWRNEKRKGKLKTEAIVLVWFFVKKRTKADPTSQTSWTADFVRFHRFFTGFPVCFPVLWQNGFHAITDRTWVRFTVRPIKPAGPVRF